MKIFLIILAVIGLLAPIGLIVCVLVVADAFQWFGEKVTKVRSRRRSVRRQRTSDLANVREFAAYRADRKRGIRWAEK